MVLRWKFDLKKAQKDRILVAPSPTRAKGISNSWGHFCVSTMFDMAPDFLDSLHTLSQVVHGTDAETRHAIETIHV
jgi:hypothetical protein